MTVVLDGSHLTTSDVLRVARGREPVEIAPEALERVRHCRDFLERNMAAGNVMYGVNTGIGELSEVVLSPEETERFQKRSLIYGLDTSRKSVRERGAILLV